MAINFDINPYYDDFDETKNYHRILFRPGYAVQARELTQLQTQIQDQINKFGKHVFVNGSIVAGGARLFDDQLLSIKINSTYSGQTVNLSNFVGKTIVGADTGTQAVIKSVSDLNAAGDPKTLLVKIISGTEFNLGENITTLTGTAYTATIYSSSAFNTAMGFSINSGVFFVDGKFVYLEAQSIPINKYANDTSHNIGFVLNEELYSSDNDQSLYDRAQDSPNFAAPGADRYKAYLSLVVKGLDEDVENFIEIARVLDGKLVTNQDKTVYSEIGKELARRTFDESGDYTVKKWPIQILDNVVLLSDIVRNTEYIITSLGTTNWNTVAGTTGITYSVGSVFTSDVNGIDLLTPGTGAIIESNTFIAALDPGKAYVKGFEFQTINQTFLTLDRARAFEQVTGIDVAMSYGNYVYVTSVFGSFVTNISASPYSSVEIHNVTRTFATTSSSKIGTAKVRFLQFNTGTPGALTAIYEMSLFDIVMDAGEYFKDAESIVIRSGATVLSGANISDSSKVGGNTGGDAFLSGSDSPGLVFPIPNQYVKTVKDATLSSKTDYTIQRTFTSVAFSAGSGSIQTDTGLERFYGGSGALSNTIKDINYHVVITAITNAGSTGLVIGDVVRFDSFSSKSITLSIPVTNSPQSATFNLNDGSFAGSATIIASITVNQQNEKKKALSKYSIKVLSPGLNDTIGGKDSLELSDIYDIGVDGLEGIYNTSSTDPVSVTIDPDTGELAWGGVAYTDVTSNYIVDNGQRSEFYDHGNLILTGTAPLNTDYLLVVYRNFTHTGNGYLSVDSYAVDYADIPQFIDPATGQTYELKDCIDFRPRRVDGGTTLNNGQIPDPKTTLQADYQYYLARIDKIIATSDQQFMVKKGIPAVYPTIPTDESNGMAIYNVVIPPYTADIRDVQIKYIDNKRYTMRDIGRLEKRISNLEYYTQLSLLEKQAKDTSIPDASNFEKFKNGFIVDTFSSADIFANSATNWSERRWGWWNAWFNGSNNWGGGAATNYNENSIAQAANIDFKAAIDPINQELRAPFTVQFSQFDTSTLTNTAKTGDLVTLSYTETTVIDQPISSSYANINPFNVLRFVGSIVLEPSFDQWVDTQYLPAVNKVVDIQLADAADRYVTEATGGSGPAFAVTGSRTTTVTNVVGSTTSTLGTNVVDIQYVPFIRPNTVLGVSKLFKPKARLYPFIENTSISAYIKPLTIVEVQNHTGTLFDDKQGVHEPLSFRTGSAAGVQTGTAKTAIYSQATTADPTKRLLTIYNAAGTIAVGKYVVGLTNGGSGVVTAVTTYSLGGNLVPDEYGNIGFEFQIPANTFKTGERTIRLIDNAANDTEAQESIGETKYTAIGTLQTKQETILTTRTLQNQKTITQIGFWYDPLGQTFLVDPRANPQGFHLSSVDVFFKSKSSTVPVTMEIRRTVNGYPESVRTIPFSECILAPEQVNIQGGGTSSTNDAIQPATTFKFANPIHLTPGEYAIVLVSQSNDYQVYISQMGSTIFGGTTKVDKQPYMGSLFFSQNASTWEPDQNKDLKFKIKRAQFATSGTAEFTIQDPAALSDYHTLFANVSSVLPTGTNVIWSAKAYNQDTTFDTEWASFNVMTDINYSYLKRLAAASGIGGTPSLRLRASLTTDNSAVSPVIDAASLSVVTALNSINNINPELEAEINQGGPALARYITKPINLAAGFEATNLCVTVDINKPSGTDVQVYYKTLAAEKNTPISDENWELMYLESAIPSSLSNYDFKEHRFFPFQAFDQYGVPNDSPISPRFNTFQIKIVMLSTSAANTPKLKDLRIIALDS
jgi:hypothetical protein